MKNKNNYTSLFKKKYSQNNIIFGDIESIIINSYHVPVLIGYSIDYKLKIFDIKENINQDTSLNIIKGFFNDINKIEGRKKIYFHNMANYDGYLISKYLIQNNIKFNIINKNNAIYKINIPEWKIDILDSYLLIPYSLENACIYLNKKYFKKEFNFNLLNEYNYLEKKAELMEYFKNDILCLEELYYNFIAKIKTIFKIDEINSLTLTSLVHKEFLKRFNTIHKFEILTERQDDFIRSGYLGGIVDVYKPFGKRIIELDVNSMYPSVMRNNKFGIGKPIYTKNIVNIKEFCEKYIGFIKCNVKSIKNMKYPTLSIKYQININNKEVSKLIQPLGEFTSVFYTKEILDCIIHQEYEFQAIEGYYFEKSDYIFKDFIEELYDIRLKAKENKDKGLEILTKKCLVSLYGRFGIKLDDDIINLYDYNEVKKINNPKEIKEFNDYALVKYTPDLIDIELNNKILKPRIDWASIVSAESRILINKIKRKIDIYYSDTDSIYIDKKDLSKISEYISKTELGKFKIEREYKYIIFIALKTYIGKTTEKKWIFKAKGIPIQELELKTGYLNDYFYKEWFKIISNKLKYNNKYNIKVIMKKSFNKELKTFSIFERNQEIMFEFNYDKRKKIYKKCIWMETKPLVIINKEDQNKLKFYKQEIRKIDTGESEKIEEIIEEININNNIKNIETRKIIKEYYKQEIDKIIKKYEGWI